MEAFGIVLSALSLVDQVTLRPFLLLGRRTFALNKYYSFPIALMINYPVRDTWCIQAEVLDSRDDGLAQEFRNSHQNECNMTAVTGAIVASIAITALQLGDLTETHWTARAFFVASLMLSLASVFTASKQHKTVGRLLRADQIRAFIGVRQDVVLGPYDFNTTLAIIFPKKYDLFEEDTDATIYLPSPASCLLLSGPRLLLSSSVVTFIVALGVYLGFLMTRHLTNDSTPDDARNIFIFYMVIGAVSYLLFQQSSTILNGRIYGVKDDGDRIMAKYADRREELLRSYNGSIFQYQDALRRDRASKMRRRARKSQSFKMMDNDTELNDDLEHKDLQETISEMLPRPRPSDFEISKPENVPDMQMMLQEAARLAKLQYEMLEKLSSSFEKRNGTRNAYASDARPPSDRRNSMPAGLY